MTVVHAVLMVATALILGFCVGFDVGYRSMRRRAAHAAQPQPHEPPHDRLCEREESVWKCHERCAWRAWKIELAHRGLVPPGPPSLRIVK